MLLTEQRHEAPVACEYLCASTVVKSLLDEFSAVTDYRTLRDSLPRRLAHLLKCRCVLLYQRIGETLQFASGTFDEKPGWSSSLLAVAHINPISTNSDTPEALAWRSRRAVTAPPESLTPTFVAVPLIYRQRTIGVLVAIRGDPGMLVPHSFYDHWSDDDVQVVEVVAGVAAMLLENTRLLERDRERIHELSLLNSISNQLHRSMHELDRIHSIVVQRAREISAADLCELILPSTPPAAIPWITPTLHEMLLQRMSGRHDPHPSPLIIEQPADPASINSTSILPTVPFPHSEYLSQLAGNIKTFFVIPLVSGRVGGTVSSSPIYGGSRHKEVGTDPTINRDTCPPGRVPTVAPPFMVGAAEIGPKMLGMLIGAYHRPWKLRHEELVLLQVLASQASAVLENIYLMADLVEARSEARKLLRQVLDDLTSIQRLEEEKRRLDRLAALGEMAANVAHEVRNPLASIKTSVQMLLYDLKEAPPINQAPPINRGATVGTLSGGQVSRFIVGPAEQLVQGDGIGWMNDGTRESVSVVLKEVERLDAIVRDLLLFAKPRQLHCVPCKLAELSDRVLQFLQPKCDEAGVVVHRLYQEVPLVRVDVAQMEQVLFNLYINALQAMPDGGVLTIGCQVIHNRLEFSVNDTGVGIPPDQLERIFQPFFTTKAHGIGLGLPITRRLIEDHHGQLLVESQFGYGTTITVRLLLVED